MTEDKPFSFYELRSDGRYDFFVDASLLRSFALCERYFYLKHVKNYRPKGVPGVKPFAMAIGSWWSDVMEQFYWSLYMPTPSASSPLTSEDIKDIAVTAWAKNNLDLCAQAHPKQFADFGDLAGAVLMLKEYHDRQFIIDKQNWRIVSVEEGFGLNREVPLGETNKVVVHWVGRPDLVVVENSRLTPVDHKTVTRINGDTSTKYKPSTQMAGYTYSCEVIAKSLGYDVRVDRCIVNICARTRPADKPRDGKVRPRFIRAYPNFTREEIAEWRLDVVHKCERIAECLRTNAWCWAETSCHNFYNRDCDFLKLDSSTPSARDVVLAADFEVGVPWKPYEVVKED